MSPIDIRMQVEREEKLEKKETEKSNSLKSASLQYDRNTDPKVIAENQKQYLQQNKNHFNELVEKAKQNMKAKKRSTPTLNLENDKCDIGEIDDCVPNDTNSSFNPAELVEVNMSRSSSSGSIDLFGIPGDQTPSQQAVLSTPKPLIKSQIQTQPSKIQSPEFNSGQPAVPTPQKPLIKSPIQPSKIQSPKFKPSSQPPVPTPHKPIQTQPSQSPKFKPSSQTTVQSTPKPLIKSPIPTQPSSSSKFKSPPLYITPNKMFTATSLTPNSAKKLRQVGISQGFSSQQSSQSTKPACPVCQQNVPMLHLNAHLDRCLNLGQKRKTQEERDEDDFVEEDKPKNFFGNSKSSKRQKRTKATLNEEKENSDSIQEVMEIDLEVEERQTRSNKGKSLKNGKTVRKSSKRLKELKS